MPTSWKPAVAAPASTRAEPAHGVAVGREQFLLPGGHRLVGLALAGQVEALDPAHEQPAVICSPLRRPVNAVKGTSAISASETNCCSTSSQTAFGYRIGISVRVQMGIDATGGEAA